MGDGVSRQDPDSVQIQNDEHKKYAFLTLKGFLANLDAQNG